MHARLIAVLLLIGMILGAATALVFDVSYGSEQKPEGPTISISPGLSGPVVDVPPADPSVASLPAPPQSLPALSAEAPPLSAPLGSLPPLPQSGNIAIVPTIANGALSPIDEPSSPAPAPPPPQDISPPRGHAKIEQRIRQINGVSSLAWGGGKTLHILVRNASPASVAQSACARANAIASGISVHVQSVSNPGVRQSQRSC